MKFAVVALALFLTTCSTVPDTAPIPQIPSGAKEPGPTVADINRNIAAAAALQGSASSSDYIVGPEDLLEIILFNIPEARDTDRHITPRTTTVRVNHQAQISLPLIGEVSVKGLTVSGLEQRLREIYDKYIHNPQVGVLVKEFRQRVSVIGAVQKPGVVELTGPKTVLEILAMAGGVNEKAGSQVHIYRTGPNGRDTHVIDLTVLANNIGLINATNAPTINMPVQPGDMINIPEAGMFFVDGAVRKPGSYALGRRYTLTQALATAGGVDSEIYSSDISIFRRQRAGEMQTIALNLNDVMSGNAADPQIQPDDVIIVPTSTAKYVVKRFVGTLLGGVSIGHLPVLFGS
jgi:polysaccharide biosynthesis/export protein